MKSKWKIINFAKDYKMLVNNTILGGTLKKVFQQSSLTAVDRNSIVTKDFISKRVAVHNGLKYCLFTVKSEMVGFRFGAFIFSKKIGSIHSKKIKKK